MGGRIAVRGSRAKGGGGGGGGGAIFGVCLVAQNTDPVDLLACTHCSEIVCSQKQHHLSHVMSEPL